MIKKIIIFPEMFSDNEEVKELVSSYAAKYDECCIGQCRLQDSKGVWFVNTFLGIPKSKYGNKSALDALMTKKFSGRLVYSDPETETFVYQVNISETQPTNQGMDNLKRLVIENF